MATAPDLAGPKTTTRSDEGSPILCWASLDDAACSILLVSPAAKLLSRCYGGRRPILREHHIQLTGAGQSGLACYRRRGTSNF